MDSRCERGEIDDAALEAGRAELDRRYEEMVARLDGTYVIPSDRDESGDNGSR